ncbi:MAG: LamG-like jellyroll fold domain-containing protein [Winogradskyella sp.]
MKTKLLLMLLFVTSLTFSQTLPSGHYGIFQFTNGSLLNTSSSGGTLAGSIVQGEDRYFYNNRAAKRINGTGRLNGFSLGAANTNEITIGFWIKSGSLPNPTRLIQIYGTNGDGFRFELDDNNLTLLTQLTTTNTVFPPSYSQAINLTNNVWRHIVLRVAYDNVNESLLADVFVDGVLQNDISNEIDPNGNNTITRFLENATLSISPLAEYIAGSIDDIYIYKTALTDQQINDIYNYNPIPGAAALTRLYVDETATGANNGDSWVNAFTNLQNAITQATDGDEIWIAGGTYKPHSSLRAEYFNITKPDLSIYGGFAGTETQLSDRVLGANETILSGDLVGDDSPLIENHNQNNGNSNRYNNSVNIIKITASGNNLLLDGVTVANAHNNIGTRGAALIKEKSVAKLTLKNCVFKQNFGHIGAAGIETEFTLATGTQGELIIENCEFSKNHSGYAAGIYAFAREDVNLNIKVENTLFNNNVVQKGSAGLSAPASWFNAIGPNANITLNLTNNTYVNHLDNSTYSGFNSAERAVVVLTETATSTINTTIANSIFWNNTVSSSQATNNRSVTNGLSNIQSQIDVYNSIDESNFNYAGINSTTATSNANPIFTNIANNDFTLHQNSPAIDTGNNSYVNTPTDLAGNQRIFNTTVDMGAYEFGSSPLGVNNFIVEEFSIYPNPTTTVLNIKMKSNLKRATIYSVLGAKVLETTSKTITTSNLKNGMYLIKIETENGSISTKRFIKQ